MIEELKNTPNTMVGFRVTGNITKKDFDHIVLPAVAELVSRTDKLNYLLVLVAQEANVIIGAWLKTAMHDLNTSEKWNRAAIVSDSNGIKAFEEDFSKVVPGEFRGFGHEELQEAIKWVGEQSGETPVQVFAVEGDRES